MKKEFKIRKKKPFISKKEEKVSEIKKGKLQDTPKVPRKKQGVNGKEARQDIAPTVWLPIRGRETEASSKEKTEKTGHCQSSLAKPGAHLHLKFSRKF